MRIFLKLAWRNVFRNKRRTLIAGTAVGLGLASLIFMDALMVAMEESMLHSATASFLGEAQIHRRGFRELLEVDQTIVDPEGVLAALAADTSVRHYTGRALAFAMISSPANVTAANLVGVDPDTERDLSQVDETIQEGNYLSGDGREILIGQKLAELLEVRLGDRVVLTAAQAHTADLAQELFRVTGIYRLGVDEMDGGLVFVPLAKAQAMLDLDGGLHEIAVNFVDFRTASDRQATFFRRFDTDENEAVGWPDLLPQMAAALQMVDVSMAISAVILFAVVSLGIINTLFMSLYERMFEFGVLRAVGTRPLALGRLIVLEAGALAVVSIVLGGLLGAVVTAVYGQIGIDYSGIEFAGATFRERLYPVLAWRQLVVYPAALFVFTLLVGLYPAHYAARMSPAGAMRKSF